MRKHMCAVTTKYAASIMTNAFDYMFLGLTGLYTLQVQVPHIHLSQWLTQEYLSQYFFNEQIDMQMQGVQGSLHICCILNIPASWGLWIKFPGATITQRDIWSLPPPIFSTADSLKNPVITKSLSKTKPCDIQQEKKINK